MRRLVASICCFVFRVSLRLDAMEASVDRINQHTW